MGDEYQILLAKDGNAWGALLGPDLQVGISGFGDSPSDALRELAKAMEAEGWKPGHSFRSAPVGSVERQGAFRTSRKSKVSTDQR